MSTVIPELLELRAGLGPHTVPLVTPAGDRYTYARWLADSRAVARGLLARGVRPGDRVGLWLDDLAVAEFAAAYTAVQHVGACPVVGKPLWTAPEAAERFAAVRSVGVISLAPPTAELTAAGLWVDTPAALSVPGPDTPILCRPGDLGQILFTSGTTGVCKPVAATHRNLVGDFAGMDEKQATDEPEVFLGIMPLGTNSGQSMVLGCLTDRVECVVVPFTAEAFCRAVQEHRPLGTLMLPVMAQQLAYFDSSGYDLGSLRYMGLTGAATPPATLARLAARLPECSLDNIYGSTESWPTFLITSFDPARPLALGRMPDDGTVRVLTEAGEPAAVGEIGEIELRAGREDDPGGRGYLDPVTSELSLGQDWAPTGDLGYVDADGYLHIVERTSRVISTLKGKISPLEVEFELTGHPSIAAAAVFPVAAEDGPEQLLAAAVVPADGPVPEQEVREYLAGRLPAHKRPSRYLTVDELPLTAAGKVDIPALTTRLRAAKPEVAAR